MLELFWIRAFLSDFSLVVRGDGLYRFAEAKTMLFHSHAGEIKCVGVISVYYRFILQGRMPVLLKYLDHIAVVSFISVYMFTFYFQREFHTY